MKIVSLMQTCDACPAQWEGSLDDGRSIYIRYRWGFLRATAGKTMSDAITVGAADMMAHVHLLRMHDEGLLDANVARNTMVFDQMVERRRLEAEQGEYLYGEQVGDEYDGNMGTETMLRHLRHAGVIE